MNKMINYEDEEESDSNPDKGIDCKDVISFTFAI